MKLWLLSLAAILVSSEMGDLLVGLTLNWREGKRGESFGTRIGGIGVRTVGLLVRIGR